MIVAGADSIQISNMTMSKFVPSDFVETLIKNAYAAEPELVRNVRAAYSGKP